MASGRKLTVLDKVCEAIETLAEPGGASRQAIAKCVKSAHGETSAALLKRVLADGVAKGKLEQTGQRFALKGVTLAPRPEETVEKHVLKKGSGAVAKFGDTVNVSYSGTLQSDGSRFDKASHFRFQIGAGEVIKGWDKGVAGMSVGEKARLVVPPKMGYGARGSGAEIPPNSTLVFEITLNSIGSADATPC
jgi:FKBP-type peptidyl-prolyl cis-trans isomerase